MTKKKTKAETKASGDKSLFRQAGEMIGSIGAHIVNAKNSVVDFVSDEVVVVKKATKKIAKKVKKATGSIPSEKLVKNPVRKTVKKVTGKLKKAASKAPSVNAIKKSVKKTAKKVAEKATGKKRIQNPSKKTARKNPTRTKKK